MAYPLSADTRSSIGEHLTSRRAGDHGPGDVACRAAQEHGRGGFRDCGGPGTSCHSAVEVRARTTVEREWRAPIACDDERALAALRPRPSSPSSGVGAGNLHEAISLSGVGANATHPSAAGTGTSSASRASASTTAAPSRSIERPRPFLRAATFASGPVSCLPSEARPSRTARSGGARLLFADRDLLVEPAPELLLPTEATLFQSRAPKLQPRPPGPTPSCRRLGSAPSSSSRRFSELLIYLHARAAWCVGVAQAREARRSVLRATPPRCARLPPPVLHRSAARAAFHP